MPFQIWVWLVYPSPICSKFRLLLDNLDIKINIDFGSDDFVLMSGEVANESKLKIVPSTLRIRTYTVRVADSTKLEHVHTTAGQKRLPAIYTLTRTPNPCKGQWSAESYRN